MKFTVASAVVFGSLALTSPAWAGLVDFGTGGTQNVKMTSCWVQDGMSMCPVNVGSSFVPHWDLQDNGPVSSTSDNDARIHRGQGGEEVEFTYAGGAFDLDSLDIEKVSLLAPSLDLTITASSGATLVETFTSDTAFTIDFTSLPGWSDITWFTMGVPLGNYGCSDGEDCSAVLFDNVKFAALPAPEPLTLSLFGAGLVGAVTLRRRKKSA